MERTYVPFQDWPEKSKQTEYTESTPLLNKDGTLNAKGWARHNVFEYDRNLVKKGLISRKEWDFYQVSNGKLTVQLNFANINMAGFVTAKLIDIEHGNEIIDCTKFFLGDKFIPPKKGDVPNRLKLTTGGAELDFDTKETSRRLWFRCVTKDRGVVECDFTMDIPEGFENITTVLPFKEDPTRYFMTTKQLGMPCAGTMRIGNDTYDFSKEDTFAFLDWGRVNTIHEMVWYWGAGAQYIPDEKGNKHLFSFEITWAIGDESNATETCIFFDGKGHKFGAIDVETFPKDDKYMEPWVFISEDGRFNLTMTPFFDYHTDLDLKIGRMNTHQVHGIWNGNVILDDGTKLEIKDMYAFCEYVENRW